MKIRSHLLIVVFSTLVPILLLAVILTAVFRHEQRSAFELRFLERVRAFSLALDRELDGHIRALKILAESDALRSGDLKKFYERAVRTRSIQSSWTNIILNDPQSGLQLVNLRVPFGVPSHETPLDKKISSQILTSDQPYMTALFQEQATGRYGTAIMVPVRSTVRPYILLAVIEPSMWLRFLSKYPVAPGATMTLLDQNGIVIARTLNNDKSVGHRPAPALYEQSRNSAEGSYKSIGLEDQWFYSAHSRSKISGWTIATGVPAETVEAVLRKSIITLAAALIGAISLALFLAYRFGRKINDAFVSLSRSARALLSGASLPSSSLVTVEEASNVAQAFQKAAEQLKNDATQLQESEERFRTMADTAPALIWVSGADKRCTYFNRPWLEFTGRRLDQELGDGWTSGIHPDDRAACLETYGSAFDEREPFELEYRLRRHDRGYRWVLDRGTPTYRFDGEFTGYIGTCIDITERKEADETLRLAREQLQTVTDTMSAAVTRCSADHRYLWVSVGFSLWLKKPVEEIQGHGIAEVIGNDAYESIRPYIARVLAGERVEYEEEVNFRGLGPRWISAVHTPTYSGEKQPDGWVAVITDITKRKRLEDALRESEQKLRQRAEDLEQQLIASGRLVSVGQITASMAHEFNNPLGIVIGFAEDLLSSKDQSDPDFDALKIIHEESLRCSKIVNELLDFSRPRNAEFSPTDIAAVIAKSIAFISARLYKCKIEPVISVAPNMPALLADTVQIEQVLLNLFLNAIDSMPGGGKLFVDVTTGKDSKDGGAPEIVITIADTGSGIDEKLLPHIFQPFFTADKKSGLGLGLAISERIIKNHAGRIEVVSKRNEGSKFTLHLPVVEMALQQRSETEREEEFVT